MFIFRELISLSLEAWRSCKQVNLFFYIIIIIIQDSKRNYWQEIMKKFKIVNMKVDLKYTVF